MIGKLRASYKNIERDIKILEILLILCFLFLVYMAITSFNKGNIKNLWELIKPAITLISALIITSVSKRLIVNNNYCLENERIGDVIMTTNYLIAINKDMLQKARYINKAIKDKTMTVIMLIELIDSINEKHKKYYDKEIYKHLPGEFVEMTSKTSEYIYSLKVGAEYFKKHLKENPIKLLNDIKNTDDFPHRNVDAFINSIEKIQDMLYKKNDLYIKVNIKTDRL